MLWNLRMDNTDAHKTKYKEERLYTVSYTHLYTGVYYDKQDGMWRAVINFQKKRTDLGRFQRIDDAIKARKDAEDRLFNRFLKELNEQTH